MQCWKKSHKIFHFNNLVYRPSIQKCFILTLKENTFLGNDRDKKELVNGNPIKKTFLYDGLDESCFPDFNGNANPDS